MNYLIRQLSEMKFCSIPNEDRSALSCRMKGTEDYESLVGMRILFHYVVEENFVDSAQQPQQPH